MRFEKANGGACGPTSVFNALEALGLHPSLPKIRKDCGTDSEIGTSEHGLKQAVERAGKPWSELGVGWDDAYIQLHAHLAAGGAAILLTEAGNHWSAAIGVSGPRIIVFNGDRAENPDNAAKNGVNVLTKRRLRDYWDTFEGRRYALLVGP